MTSVSDPIKTRAEVLSEDQWNVAAIFPSFETWEKEYAGVCENTSAPYWPRLQSYRGKLKDGAERLKRS